MIIAIDSIDLIEKVKGNNIIYVFDTFNAEDIKKAYEEIWDYFADPSFLEEVPAIYAELTGLDVY